MGLCHIRFLAMCLQKRQLEEQAPSNPLEYVSFFSVLSVLFGLGFFLSFFF